MLSFPKFAWQELNLLFAPSRFTGWRWCVLYACVIVGFAVEMAAFAPIAIGYAVGVGLIWAWKKGQELRAKKDSSGPAP
jgi:hypothetical protein